MNTKKYILFLFFTSLLNIAVFVACNNSNAASYDTIAEQKKAASTGKKPAGNNIIQFKVDDNLVTTSTWVITRFTLNGHEGIKVTSDMHEEKQTVSFNLNDDKPGNHSLSSGAKGNDTGYGNYKPDYEEIDAYSFQSGQVNIISIDTVKGLLNAEFSGIVIDPQGNSISITEGQIVNAPINKRVIHY